MNLAATPIAIPHPPPGRTMRARCPQPACRDKRGESLAVTADDDGRGRTWICHRCGWSGGERDDRASERAPRLVRPAAARQQTRDVLSAWGRELWAACRPIGRSDPAGRYLAARGYALPHPDGDLRWHPSLRHPAGHVGPALVGLVTDVRDASRWFTLHRTWITGDGSGRKASVDQPRLLLRAHPKAGGVIRLWPDCEVTLRLGLAEGVENALVLARGFTPVWAAIDAGNLGGLPYLYPIESITVAVDFDAAGLAAFDRLAKTWLAGAAAHGIRGEARRIRSPQPGEDLADWARRIDDA